MLQMSTDGGNTFNDTHLPAAATGQYINILDTSDLLVFAHITDPSGKWHYSYSYWQRILMRYNIRCIRVLGFFGREIC